MSAARDVRAVDLFAGPGGWDEGVRELGVLPLGVELEGDACATRAAAGHATMQADVSTLDPLAFGEVDLLLASPPCPTFSAAGKGEGRAALPELIAAIRGGARAPALEQFEARTRLVLEPLRFALALSPRWVAFEQVPGALEVWEWCADALRVEGYSVWTGTLNAADYGVPQTRTRALLLASLEGEALPPPPTHAQHGADTLLGELAPWVTMADALGWGATDRPYATLAGGTQGGPCYDFLGGSGARAVMLDERRAGRWIDCPWPWRFPSTTVCADPRVSARCHHDHGSQGLDARTTDQVRDGEYTGTEPIRLTTGEAATLQSFRADYPWHGTQTSKHTQIGNAVPPLLARAVVAELASLHRENTTPSVTHA